MKLLNRLALLGILLGTLIAAGLHVLPRTVELIIASALCQLGPKDFAFLHSWLVATPLDEIAVVIAAVTTLWLWHLLERGTPCLVCRMLEKAGCTVIDFLVAHEKGGSR